MRITLVLVHVVAAGLFVTGCSSNNTDSDSAGATTTADDGAEPPSTVVGTELPVEINSPQPDLMSVDDVYKAEPLAGSDAPILDKVLHELRRETLLMTLVPGKITAACDGDRIAVDVGAATSCITTYEGVQLDWLIIISMSGPRLIEYRISLSSTKGILTAKYVYGYFWLSYKDHSDKLRCDTIPNVTLVDLPISDGNYNETGYKCQYLGPIEDNVRTWEDVSIKVGHNGRITF